MLGGEERHVAEATKVTTDPRVQHYWDEQNQMGESYRSILKLSEPAWDVFLLFDRVASWPSGRPPGPTFWMHQLPGVTHGPQLDADGFVAKAEELLR
jgi:hypothetical protein